jgi:peptide/nickel transport system ATP-binding protein
VDPVLDIRGLTVAFRDPGGDARALFGVDLTVQRGEIVALVGESGSGKSMTGFAITAFSRRRGRSRGARCGSAAWTFCAGLPPEAMRRVRGRRVAMIFQDPMMTLNPVLRIETQMTRRAARARGYQPPRRPRPLHRRAG